MIIFHLRVHIRIKETIASLVLHILNCLIIYFIARWKIPIKYKSDIRKYEVLGSDSVKELKKTICKKESMVSDGMNFVCGDKWLNDDACWSKTDVFGDDNSLLHFCKR